MGFLPAMVRIIEIFKKFDKNNDGVISKQALEGKDCEASKHSMGMSSEGLAIAKSAPKWLLFDESGPHGNPRS